MSTETATKELPALHEDTLVVSGILQKDHLVDKKTGTGGAAPDIYEAVLAQHKAGETFTLPEAAKELQKLNTTFFAAAHHATGAIAEPILAKNKELTEVVVEFPMLGKDRYDVTYRRSKEVNAGIQKAGEPPVPKKTIYGQTTATLNIHATGNVGEVSKVRKHLAAQAEGLFGPNA